MLSGPAYTLFPWLTRVYGQSTSIGGGCMIADFVGLGASLTMFPVCGSSPWRFVLGSRVALLLGWFLGGNRPCRFHVPTLTA